jgi:uncharacterized protein (DUF169 family)
MITIKEAKDVSKQLQDYLRLRTHILGFKLLEEESELRNIKKIRRPSFRGSLCQFITIARTYGWDLGLTRDDLAFPTCAAIIGFCEMPQEYLEGKVMNEVWFKTTEDASKHMRQMPRVQPGKYHAAVISPLSKGLIEPDIIFIYSTPAQMVRLLTGIQYYDYERLQFFYTGEESCADAIAQCYLTQKPSLTIPCFGERRFGGVMEDEVVITIPWGQIEKLLDGLEKTDKSGLRYPIPFYGCTYDPRFGVPGKYQNVINKFCEGQ